MDSLSEKVEMAYSMVVVYQVHRTLGDQSQMQFSGKNSIFAHPYSTGGFLRQIRQAEVS